MAVHTSKEIAAFTKGDERMLWAADRVTRRIFYLHDGEAERFRVHTKENLVCVVLDCPAPTITVVARRGNRRQGFRHHTKVDGEGHAMGVLHIQGQNEIRKWLTEKYGNSTVELEVPINGDRERIADVMMTAGSGERVAFEVQYASLNAAKWEERHADYVAAGIPDVWLFGHAGIQLKLDRDKNVKLNATHRAAAQAGLHLLWFNPLDKVLATVTVPWLFPASVQTVDVPVYGVDAINAELPAATLHLFPLADAYVNAGGLTAPVLLKLESALAEAVKLEATAVAAAAAALKAAEAAARKRANQEIRYKANKAAKMERIRKSHVERKLAWPDHPLRRSVLDQFDGSWPQFLDVEPKGEGDYSGSPIFTPFPHQQWEATLYMTFMHGKGDRTSVTIKECAAHLVALDRDTSLAEAAVTMWFRRLVKFGVLEKEAVRWRGGSDGIGYVTRTRKTERSYPGAGMSTSTERSSSRSARAIAQREAAAREQERFIAEAVALKQLKYRSWHGGLLSAAELSAIAKPAKEIPAGFTDGRRCTNCYGALSQPDDEGRGYHLACATQVYRSAGLVIPAEPS